MEEFTPKLNKLDNGHFWARSLYGPKDQNNKQIL